MWPCSRDFWSEQSFSNTSMLKCLQVKWIGLAQILVVDLASIWCPTSEEIWYKTTWYFSTHTASSSLNRCFIVLDYWVTVPVNLLTAGLLRGIESWGQCASEFGINSSYISSNVKLIAGRDLNFCCKKFRLLHTCCYQYRLLDSLGTLSMDIAFQNWKESVALSQSRIRQFHEQAGRHRL